MALFLRGRTLVLALLAVLLLSGCLGQLVAAATKEVLFRLLVPMVGLDPNETRLFQQPIIRDRLQAFLGPQYEPVVALLGTAEELQREGPLFYVVSRYTPVPEFAEQAGFVWDADANRMAVMLVTGGSPTVIAEQLVREQAAEQVAGAVAGTPVGEALRWPGQLQAILDADAQKKRLEEQAVQAVSDAVIEAITPAPPPAGEAANPPAPW